MVYIDDYDLHGRKYHLVTDGSIDELHAFAASIGMLREWFQSKPCKHPHPHYDVKGNRMRMAAIKAGAIEITYREAAVISANRYEWRG